MRYKPFGTKPGPAEITGPGSQDPGTKQATSHISGQSHTDRQATERKRSKRDEVSLMKPESDIEQIAVEKSRRKKPKKTHLHSPERIPKDQFRHIEPDMTRQSLSEKENIERGRVKQRDSHEILHKGKRHKDETSQERRARKEDRKRKKVEKQSKLPG
jgi:hypothetical protein